MKVEAASIGCATHSVEPWGASADERPADMPAPTSSIEVVTTFDDLYDKHLSFVWRVLRALGVSREVLDDAVQDVFLVVHRRLDSFDRSSKATSWLFGIALRVARGYRRRPPPGDDLSTVENALRDGSPSPLEQIARSEKLALLERVLDSLDDKKRIVFVSMEIEQMSAEEVATMLGINVNTVYSRRRLARLEFDRLLAIYGKSKRKP